MKGLSLAGLALLAAMGVAQARPVGDTWGDEIDTYAVDLTFPDAATLAGSFAVNWDTHQLYANNLFGTVDGLTIPAIIGTATISAGSVYLDGAIDNLNGNPAFYDSFDLSLVLETNGSLEGNASLFQGVSQFLGYGSDPSHVPGYPTEIVLNTVPEPSTLAVLGLGLLGLAGARYRYA